jgi:hypothetical protein
MRRNIQLGAQLSEKIKIEVQVGGMRVKRVHFSSFVGPICHLVESASHEGEVFQS